MNQKDRSTLWQLEQQFQLLDCLILRAAESDNEEQREAHALTALTHYHKVRQMYRDYVNGSTDRKN